MPTQLTNWTRSEAPAATTGADLGLALLFHLAIAGALFGMALLHPRSKAWGDNAATAGAIQATMVNAIPLPPKQPVDEKSVLASETPSPAPIVTKETTPPPPSPKDIPIEVKEKPRPAKPLKEAPITEAVKHPAPIPPPPTKATTGDTGGMRIAQSTVSIQHGTASASILDRSFGDRFAYYRDAVTRRVSQNWYTQEATQASLGKSVTLLFDIDHDGVPSNVRVERPSGSPLLDTSAVRAVQRVDAFGPLPGGGNRVTVEFTFIYHP